jgi:DegV family protein with EDD domain
MSAQRVAVVTDSTAYLPPEVRERLDIPVIPLHVVWGKEVLKDGVDIQPAAFYERLQTESTMPTTSQPSAGEFVDFFRQVAEERDVDAIAGFFISSALSGTVTSAQAAQGLLPDLQIEVIDSRSTAMGLGFQVMAAAEAAQAGEGLKKVVEAGCGPQFSCQVLFLVDTLEFLHRGGRIGGARRFLGTALKIKPILGLEEGKIESFDQVRTHKKALKRLLEISRERSGEHAVPRASVIHANALEEGRALKPKVEEILQPEEIYLADVSPVIGTHTGPRSVGVCFYTE